MGLGLQYFCRESCLRSKLTLTSLTFPKPESKSLLAFIEEMKSFLLRTWFTAKFTKCCKRANQSSPMMTLIQLRPNNVGNFPSTTCKGNTWASPLKSTDTIAFLEALTNCPLQHINSRYKVQQHNPTEAYQIRCY